MNDYLISCLLGIVEGLTEFLPVSSTAHLRIVEQLLHLPLSSDYWKMYSIVIQLGAILCLPIYFFSRIKGFCATFPKGRDGDRTLWTHPLTLVLLAFVLTAGPSWWLEKKIGKNLESLTIMGAALLIGGVVMWVVDVLFTRPRTLEMEKMSTAQAAWVGLLQNLAAIFPGTSRSMATISAGQSAGMSRAAALEFSFFLSIPTMFAATGYKLLKPLAAALRGKPAGDYVMDAHHWGVLLVGFVVSFFVAWAVVAWFMAWVRKHGFVPFAVYRIIIGIAVLIWSTRIAV